MTTAAVTGPRGNGTACPSSCHLLKSVVFPSAKFDLIKCVEGSCYVQYYTAGRRIILKENCPLHLHPLKPYVPASQKFVLSRVQDTPARERGSRELYHVGLKTTPPTVKGDVLENGPISPPLLGISATPRMFSTCEYELQEEVSMKMRALPSTPAAYLRVRL